MRDEAQVSAPSGGELESRPTDIASPLHWEKVWTATPAVPRFSAYNYYDFRLAKVFRPLAPAGACVLEIGCGGSRWIEYFNRVLGCETWGIDYSPEGLALTERSNQGAPRVHLLAADFFAARTLPLQHFDFIYSLGFIEHFAELEKVTRRIFEILRPGGRVMTLVPNFLSVYGEIQKRVNPDTFSKHVVVTRAALDDSHRAGGMNPLERAHFFGCLAPGVVDYGRWQKLVLPTMRIAQHLACWALHAVSLDRESRIASPYIVGIYEKPRQG